MKRYRVSESNKKYLRKVLTLSRTQFWFKKDQNGQWWCYTNLSSNHFRRMVLRARCEKATEDTGILHVTYQESLNQAFTTALMQQKKASTFVIINDKNARSRLAETK